MNGLLLVVRFAFFPFDSQAQGFVYSSNEQIINDT